MRKILMGLMVCLASCGVGYGDDTLGTDESELVATDAGASSNAWCGAPCQSNEDCTEKVGVGGSTSCGTCRAGLCRGSEPVTVPIPAELQLIQPRTGCIWGATTDCLSFGGATGSDNAYCRSVCPSSMCLEVDVPVYLCSIDSSCFGAQWQNTICSAAGAHPYLCARGSQDQGRCTYLTAPK